VHKVLKDLKVYLELKGLRVRIQGHKVIQVHKVLKELKVTRV
jgi:hypothetical protein